QALRSLALTQTFRQPRKRDERIMRRQIPRLFGEGPRRNRDFALALAEAVIGEDQRLAAARPSERGECACAIQQIKCRSFHRSLRRQRLPVKMKERNPPNPASDKM